MSDRGVVQEEPEERPGWLYPLIVFSVTAVIGAGILLYLLAPSVDELTGVAIRPTSEVSDVQVALGQRRFVIPSNYIRVPAARAGGAMDRIELDAILPDMHGFSNADAEAVKDVSRASPIVSITLRSGSPALSERDKFDRIYLRNVDPEGEVRELEGFEATPMAENSGYAGQQVLVRDDGDAMVVLLCTSDVAGYDIGGLCQREIAWGDGMTLTYGFRKGHLADWDALDGKVRQLVERLELTP